MRYLVFFLFSLFLFQTGCQSKAAKTDSKVSNEITQLPKALEMMNKNDVVTIDIRTPEEIAKGKIIDSAIEMDFYADDFKSKVQALDRDKNYMVYCRSGNRSGKTLKMMEEMGFKNAYHYKGGYKAFEESKK